MKRFSLLLSLMAAFVLIFAFTACTEQTPVDNPSEEGIANVPDLMILNTTYSESDVQAGTMDQDYAMRPPMERKERCLPFGRILRQLELTTEQQDAIKAYMDAYKDCLTLATEALREAEAAILEAAKAERREIMQNLRDGVITREEAREQMKVLNESVREQLQNLEGREAAQEAVKDCLDTLFANIRSVLTEEQQTKWDEWVANFNNHMGGGRGNGMGMGHRR